MAPTETHGRARAHASDRACTFLLSSAESVPIRGQAEWVTLDQAYVVVPYGTARSVRECWNAVAIIPDRKRPDQSREIQLKAELVSAESIGAPEGDQEGLLLRLTGVGERLLSELASALPKA